MKKFLSMLGLLSLFNCGGVEYQKVDELKYNDASFGLMRITVNSLSRYRIVYSVYYQPANSKKKYEFGIQTPYSGVAAQNPGIEFSYFPPDSLLDDFAERVIIDTTARDMDHSKPTNIMTTLYVHPLVFSQEDYQQIVGFIKENYRKDDDENIVLQWLNKGWKESLIPGDGLSSINYTVYAVIYGSPRFVYSSPIPEH